MLAPFKNMKEPIKNINALHIILGFEQEADYMRGTLLTFKILNVKLQVLNVIMV